MENFEQMELEEVKRKKERKFILAIATDENNYYVDIPAGSNVAETAFAIHCVIKMLVRDGMCESNEVFLDMIKKYLGDPQYEEVK